MFKQTTFINKLKKQINQWGASRTPFLFVIDFEMEEHLAIPLSEIDSQQLLYNFNGQKNHQKPLDRPHALIWQPTFPLEASYQKAFDIVQSGIARGDSYLVNLTFPSQVQTNWTLRNIFDHTVAPYKLWLKDRFAVFSPESFIQIKDNRVYSFPMKGTLPAYYPAHSLLNDAKEKSEHATIVDLIRNDLSSVASKVQVDRYRYLDRLHTNQADLWQTSSQISGILAADYHHFLGDVLFKLLPAGSISGAPKAATIDIIQRAENQKRGFYTGVACLWDGYTLDSCVLIRFVEKTAKNHQYWSGGGVTAYSNWEKEYKELKEKVYLPVETENYTQKYKY